MGASQKRPSSRCAVLPPMRLLRHGLVLALALAATAATRGNPSAKRDPLAAEIERWSGFLRTHQSEDADWEQIKGIATPVMEDAAAALKSGRRLFALQRLAAARTLLSASLYAGERTERERQDEAAFEAEWARMGKVLGPDLAPPSPSAFEGVLPAAVRALGEAALPQIKIFYDTSLDYARNTLPASGIFYIGEARAQQEFAAFARTLDERSAGVQPPLRSLASELDALEGRILAAYRPPASIDKHAEFIGASATLKEARELDAAGLRYAALLRYLQAAQRVSLLGAKKAPVDAAALRTFGARLSAGGVDHSIGRLFLESAQADLAAAAAGAVPERASVIASDVLPRYFAALEPARPAAPRPAAAVTVTLVRWPYT